MAQHVWVNPGRLQRARKTLCVDGVDLIVELSPYDTPRSIVGEYDQVKQRFVIRFQYIDDEPARTNIRAHEGIEVREGRYSGKLLSVSIPVDVASLDAVAILRLRTRVLEALKSRHLQGKDKTSETMNVEVAEELLDSSNFNTLAKELEAIGSL